MEKLSKASKHQFPERATLLGDELSITRNMWGKATFVRDAVSSFPHWGREVVPDDLHRLEEWGAPLHSSLLALGKTLRMLG